MQYYFRTFSLSAVVLRGLCNCSIVVLRQGEYQGTGLGVCRERKLKVNVANGKVMYSEGYEMGYSEGYEMGYSES
mgnify:CR=1 FL=1